jgi:hypothetical protein
VRRASEQRDRHDRTLGDFFQLRIGSKGEAKISYADSTSLLSSLLGTHAMFVSQIDGSGRLLGCLAERRLDPAQTPQPTPRRTRPYDAAGLSSANMPNLDVVGSKVSWPSANSCRPAGTPCLRVWMKVSNLTTAAPAAPDTDTDTDLVWLTQRVVPARGYDAKK